MCDSRPPSPNLISKFETRSWRTTILLGIGVVLTRVEPQMQGSSGIRRRHQQRSVRTVPCVVYTGSMSRAPCVLLYRSRRAALLLHLSPGRTDGAHATALPARGHRDADERHDPDADHDLHWSSNILAEALSHGRRRAADSLEEHPTQLLADRPRTSGFPKESTVPLPAPPVLGPRCSNQAATTPKRIRRPRRHNRERRDANGRIEMDPRAQPHPYIRRACTARARRAGFLPYGIDRALRHLQGQAFQY